MTFHKNFRMLFLVYEWCPMTFHRALECYFLWPLTSSESFGIPPSLCRSNIRQHRGSVMVTNRYRGRVLFPGFPVNLHRCWAFLQCDLKHNTQMLYKCAYGITSQCSSRFFSPTHTPPPSLNDTTNLEHFQCDRTHIQQLYKWDHTNG